MPVYDTADDQRFPTYEQKMLNYDWAFGPTD